jgi:ATP-dependent DNA ligase
MPMEARPVDELPGGPGWQFEPKWDGFRCLAYKDGARCELQGKSGKSLSQFFPEVAALIANLAFKHFTDRWRIDHRSRRQIVVRSFANAFASGG